MLWRIRQRAGAILGGVRAFTNAGMLLGIAADNLPVRSDVTGQRNLIAFNAFLTILRIAAVVVLLDFVFNIGAEEGGGQQQAFIHQLPLGAELAGFGLLRFKVGSVGAAAGAALREGKVAASRRLLGNGVVDVEIAVIGQVVQRAGLPVHQVTAG